MGVYKFSAPGTLKTGRTLFTSMLAGNPVFVDWQPGKDFDSIATVSVGGGGAANITFSSIPDTYRHLQIRLLARSTQATGTQNVNMLVNSLSGDAWHRIFGNGTSAGANSQSNAPVIIGQIPGSTAAASVFGVATIDLLDYKEPNKNKTARALFGFDDNNGGAGAVVQLFSGLWTITSAATSISLTAGAGFAQYTQAALYGVK